jgi:hypothetical protein
LHKCSNCVCLTKKNTKIKINKIFCVYLRLASARGYSGVRERVCLNGPSSGSGSLALKLRFFSIQANFLVFSGSPARHAGAIKNWSSAKDFRVNIDDFGFHVLDNGWATSQALPARYWAFNWTVNK